MKSLVLEFSSDHRSVAVVDGDSVVGEAQEIGGRGGRPLGLIQSALGQAALDPAAIGRLVIGVGPGSYAGIRTAIALAIGWKMAADVRIETYRSLDAAAALARRHGIRGQACGIVDAQRAEYYRVVYQIDEHEARPTSELEIVTQDQLCDDDTPCFGPLDAKRIAGITVVYPEAAAVARLARYRHEILDPGTIEPLSLRAVEFVKAPKPSIQLSTDPSSGERV